MHELSLAHSICEAVVPHVPTGQRLSTVVVEWGPLSGVVPDALEYCFNIVAESTGLVGAKLDIRTVAAQARCPSCEASFEVEQMWSDCPQCGHSPVTIAGGREFRVKEIEVEDV